MKLEGLRILHEQLQRELERDATVPAVYYFYQGKWNDLSTEAPCSDLHSRDLDRARRESIAYHATSSLDAWFFLADVEVAVRLTFTQSPQLSTRRRFRERLLKIQESASNAYKVTHNPLTQLLARDAFRNRLSAAIVAVEKRDPARNDAQESGVARALAVLALDIDHFKQVNDTWGHLYGDQVLKVFARRLESCAEQIRSVGTGKPAVFLGHPSGEEFLVILEANAARDQFVEWANEFRKAVAEQVLPTESEWEWLTATGQVAVISPPPLHERTVTTSIGLALHSGSSTAGASADVLSDLLERADTALYRAKAAGRNQVISYDEILLSCGRVLEQDSKTRVLALDIGSNVGVAVGQEFKVFLPSFSGKAKFFLNDGRTRRTLGLYPRVESARIVVFNAQPELSFAFIAAPDTAPAIEPGSHLEAIPAGSIGHLLPSSSKYFQSGGASLDRSGLVELQSFLKANASTAPFAVVVRFARDAEYLRKYGSVALNMALAQLYRAAQIDFHAAKAIEVLDRSAICVGGSNSAYKESIVEEFVSAMAAELPELGVVAGVFCDADRKAATREQLNLDTANAIEFARFAAADAGRPPDARIRHFGRATAIAVLQSLRESRSFDVAYTDFERLRKLGVDDAAILNIGGLIAASLGLGAQALEHYAAAIAKAPSQHIYKSNYGLVAYSVGEFDSALRILNALSSKDMDGIRVHHPYGYLGYARLLARAAINASPMFDAAKFSVVAPTVLAMPEFANSAELEVIREALQLP